MELYVKITGKGQPLLRTPVRKRNSFYYRTPFRKRRNAFIRKRNGYRFYLSKTSLTDRERNHKRKRRFYSTFLLITVLWCIVLQHYIFHSDADPIFGHSEKNVAIDETELKYFPLADLKDSETGTVFSWDFADSWHTERTFGGSRSHEGCDIMTEKNLPGQYPVISISDGVVEKIGWLKLGGYRIGIRTSAGLYLYYAHLESYMPELQEGSMVKAGDFLGFAGNTGYGPEGTSGKFATHLHMGFYVTDKNGKEAAVNPYPYLIKLKQHTLTYHYPKDYYDKNNTT